MDGGDFGHKSTMSDTMDQKDRKDMVTSPTFGEFHRDEPLAHRHPNPMTN